MEQEYFNICDKIDKERAKSKLKFSKLKKECVRVKESILTNSIYIQSYRIKNKNKKSEFAEWRTLFKMPGFFIGKKRWVRSNDDLGDIRYIIDSNVTQNMKYALGDVLDNRRYFKPCYNCGCLAHVDNMVNRVCQECIAEGDAEKRTERDEFVKRFISVIEQNDLIVGIVFNHIEWHEPYLPVAKPKIADPTFDPFPSSDSKKLYQTVNRVLANRKYFDICLGCGEWNHVGHMGGGCHTCMEDSGIVF